MAAAMTSRERFAAAMAHRSPDRPPLDIGATSLTGMRPGCQGRLLELLDLPGEPRIGHNGVDLRVLEWAGTDFRAVGGIFQLPSPHTRRISDSAFVDCWGIRHDIVGGEYQITESPLRGADRADLAAFPWPEPRIDEALLAQFQERAAALQAEGRYVVVAEHPVFGVLELGCWMCGYDDFMLKAAMDPDFVRDFFDRFLAIQMAIIEPYYRALGPYIDLTISGDDFGTQQGPIMSPEMFAELVAPPFTERIARTKAIAGCYYWHHTCGSVHRLLDQIIGCGVDILNPVQTSAREMEPERLKRDFGDRIVFWGGVDVQQFLPKASPSDVPETIRALAATLGRDGGYVMAPAHEMQDDIPAENIAAWVETHRTLG